MHPPDKIQQFFDLRSRGNCLSYISRTIGVAISTLSDWNRRYAPDIDASRACKWEAAEQAIKFNTEADLVRVIQRIDTFERELDHRSPGRMSVGELVRVISLWRREYFRRRNGLLSSIERPAPIPESESEISGNIPNLPESYSAGARPSPVATPASSLACERPHLTNPATHDTVTPDLRAEPRCKTESNSRGLTSHDTSENTAAFSANAAHDNATHITTKKPESETKPEKTGIPESHSPTFSPAAPHAAAALNSQLSTLNSSPPPLFSLEDYIPAPVDEWLPHDDDKLRVYRPREAIAADLPFPQKTNIASAP